MAAGPGASEEAGWTFFSNHSHVLFCLAQEPGLTLREVATRVGITERAVQKIVADLEQGGFLERERVGRRNVYTVHGDLPLRHPVEAHCRVEQLIELIRGGSAPGKGTRRRRRAR